MFGIGLPELLVILVVALFVVGPKKLPGVARSLGQGVTELKKAAGEVMGGVTQHEEFQEFKKMKDDLQDTVNTVRNPMAALTESVKDEFAQTIDVDPEPDKYAYQAASGADDAGTDAGVSDTGLQDSASTAETESGSTPTESDSTPAESGSTPLESDSTPTEAEAEKKSET